MKPLLLFQVLFLMLGSVVAQGYFLTPPYLQNVAVSSVTVMWESVSNIPGVVNYGTTNAYGSSVASTVVNSNANTFIHKAIISSLEEATVYYYQVSCNGTSHPEQHFKTATKDVNASFTVGIWGDSHYVNPFSKMAAYLVNNLNVDFCFSSGDLSNLGYDHADLAPGGWLENFLKSPVLHQAKFRFIFIHCPPFLERWQIAEMGIVKNNLPSLCEKYGVSLKEVAYVGDDINDIPMLDAVGFSACPANAPDYVKSHAVHVLKKNGGDGAFREFVEYILEDEDLFEKAMELYLKSI